MAYMEHSTERYPTARAGTEMKGAFHGKISNSPGAQRPVAI